jgi:CheY-like chemotaxis protein
MARFQKEGDDMTAVATGQKTVLIIEDDPWTRTITTALLAGEGFAVVEAKNGEEGLSLAREHAPDAVLLDLALPTKSGLEVLRELKDDGEMREIPVIVVSAYGTLMNEQDAHQTAGVIQKPFDYDDLVGQVSRATARDFAVALT